MTLSLMIKKKYLLEKVEEQENTGTFTERRSYSRFWRARIKATGSWGPNDHAVFLCGRHAYPAEIIQIVIGAVPTKYRDVLVGDVCYCVICRFADDVIKAIQA